MVLGAFAAVSQGVVRVLPLRLREGGRRALVTGSILIQLSPALLLSASASLEEKRDYEKNQLF